MTVTELNHKSNLLHKQTSHRNTQPHPYINTQKEGKKTAILIILVRKVYCLNQIEGNILNCFF